MGREEGEMENGAEPAFLYYCISCPIKTKFQNYESLKLYIKQLDLAVAKPTLAKQNDAYRNDFLNTTNQTKVQLGNTLTTASMCNISSVYIMHVMII